MAVSLLQLDVGLGGPELAVGVLPISALRLAQGLVPESGGCHVLTESAGKVWFGNRPSKQITRHPDSKHENSKSALWVKNWRRPGQVEAQLAILDAGTKWPPASVATSVQRAFSGQDGHSEVEMCKKLCDEGRTIEAVNALNLLVQRGYHVSNNLFYRLLKRCIVQKDLVLGRRIHSLTVQSGYEGDAFLATHLMGLYASLGRLEEAMQVFSKVSPPDAHNWATIIFAHGRHGEPAQAIRLYRKMRESAVEPDNRIYTAVLKACATAGDLIAGKEVHGHILASRGKPDIFVQNGLLDMYAKCGSIDDARGMFDRLPMRTVVTWTTMIAGYAQQGMGQEALTLYNIMQLEGLSPPDSVTFLCLLQACASMGEGALDTVKLLHAQIQEQGLQDDVVLGGSLVTMYAKCGSINDARTVFDRLRKRNVVTWNSMIAGYAQQGMGQEALVLYKSMLQEGLFAPNSVTFLCLLQACASVGVGALHEGKQLHAQIETEGLQDDAVLGCSLVNMYAKCGSLENARRVFDRMQDRNVVTWTAMIAGYVQQGMGQEALRLYNGMQQDGLSPPDSVTFVCLLQACASVGVAALHHGKQLHGQIEERGLQDDLVLGGSLVNMYAKCGSLKDARSVFDRLLGRNVVTWNTMITGYAQHGMGEEALSLYRAMQHEGLSSPSSVTFVCLLQACASVGLGALNEGKQLHAQIEEQGLHNDVLLGSSLINMYAKCGTLEHARTLFDRLPHRNITTWNAMIAGYAQQGMGQEALNLYSNMVQESLSAPDSVTFVCLLQACAGIGVEALHQGKQFHEKVVEQGLHNEGLVGCSLVNMYSKCGSLEDARRVFDRLRDKSVATWTTMIAGYAQQGMGEEALSLYSDMQQEGLSAPSSVTFLCLLQACATVGDGALHVGKQLHAQIEEKGLQDDVALGGSLVNMYAKCGSVVDARSVFDRLRERNVVTWTAMIAGYAQQGMGQEALTLYDSMQQEGLSPPDSVTFVCLLQACAIVASLPLGTQLHAEIKKRGMQSDVAVGAALVNMYAKCGSMTESQQVFDSLPERTIEAWGALVGGYTRQGDSDVVFALLDRMKLEGVQPNDITLLSVLTVCSHVGLVDKGRNYFDVMTTEYGISPTVEHYICIMDLLGRAGHLDEALQMAKTMPFPPNIAVWHTLLGACQKWSNVEIGQEAFEFAVKLDEKDSGSHVLMSNIYARAQMWEEAEEMQERRVKCGAWKEPGQCWWTDMGGVAHSFVAGDKKQPDSEGTHASLEGYVLDSSLQDMPDKEKEAELYVHIEELALALSRSSVQCQLQSSHPSSSGISSKNSLLT